MSSPRCLTAPNPNTGDGGAQENFSCSGCSKACGHAARNPSHVRRRVVQRESEFTTAKNNAPKRRKAPIPAGRSLRKTNDVVRNRALARTAIDVGKCSLCRRMAQSRASGGRLSVDYCFRAGYALPADEGLEALKVDRLCTRLGVTKGSLYWHFKDMAGYRARARAGAG
ncbi:helix-turn-helix domain-containing protein [Mycolicibacterium iranicum]|uniref:helix-turn-helix domain-containing protein n=1 Tax=Mycolicibacterium iranicum TaxID=912594 RepID=UPI002E14F41E